MELRQLRTFAMAAEFENFTRTAEALAVTQPAVSQQVSTLEHELGVSLFRRRGPKIRLTDAGKRLYEYARAALDLLDRASSDIGAGSQVVSGTLRIASCTIPPETFLPELLVGFRQAYPDVREIVSVSDTVEATRAVETGEADLGFVVVPPRQTHLQSKPIVCHELVLVVSCDHPLANRDVVSADELVAEPFILREEGSGTRQITERVLREAGISPAGLEIALETNSNDAIRRAVQQGGGVAVLSQASVQDDIAQGRLVAVNVEGLQARLNTWLVTDPERIPTLATRAFLGFLE